MSVRDFERNVDASLMPQVEESTACASVKGWEEDGFAQWVSDHKDEAKSSICSMSEYRDVIGCQTS